MAGKLPRMPGEFPTLANWENHLSTIYTEVRSSDGDNFWKFLQLLGSKGFIFYHYSHSGSVEEIPRDEGC